MQCIRGLSFYVPYEFSIYIVSDDTVLDVAGWCRQSNSTATDRRCWQHCKDRCCPWKPTGCICQTQQVPPELYWSRELLLTSNQMCRFCFSIIWNRIGLNLQWTMSSLLVKSQGDTFIIRYILLTLILSVSLKQNIISNRGLLTLYRTVTWLNSFHKSVF